MGSKFRKIELNISNDELNALEDLITVELDGNTEMKARKKSLKVWMRMVSAFDKAK